MPRRKGPSLTRADVIAAAIACVDEGGASSLGVNRIARRLKIRPPSLYNHVKGIDDLRRSVALVGWSNILEMHRVSAEKEMGLALLRAFGYTFRSFAKSRPGLYTITVTTALGGMEDSEFGPMIAEFLAMYAAALEPFGLTEDEVQKYGTVTRAALQGLIDMELQDHFPSTAFADGCFEFLMKTLTNAGTLTSEKILST